MKGIQKPENQCYANPNITDSGKDSSMGSKPLSERLLENRIISPWITSRKYVLTMETGGGHHLCLVIKLTSI